MLSTVEKVREESDDESIQDQEYSYAPLQNEPDEQPIEPIKVTIKEQDRMSKEEISRIKEVMSKIKLDPPPNFANLNDEDWMPTATLSDRIKHCEDQLSEIISEILEKCKNQTSTQEIDQIATLLWNCSISQKHSISSIALLRQSSLDLFSSIILVDSASFPQLSKLSLLAIKTGSSWFTAGDHIKAHNAYIKASSFIDRFSSLKADKATATKIIVFHGLYKAQLLFTSNPPLAFHVLLGLNQADFNLLEKNDRTNLANISLSSAKCENKEHAIEWLRFGAELGPKTSQIRGQILLMLANTYLELSREGDLDLSLSTLDVLLTTGNETLASAAALVKIKVLVAKNSPVHTVSLVFEESITLLTQNTMPKSIDVYFAMIHLIAKFFDTSAALNAINLVHSRIAKFANKKSITDRLFVTSLYFLINPTTPTDNSSEIEKLVDICGEIGTESLRSCMILVWQAGERSLESDIKVSIYWFLLAVKLMGDKTDKTNCAIVFRKLALCYNELSLFREMAECIHSAEMIEESHLNSYLRCMLIIQENDSSKIDEIKQRLSGNYQNKTEIISSLAETASSKGESGKLFLRALLDEMRLEKSENTVIILRSLIKLLQSLDKNWQLEVCVYIEQFAELQVSKSLACGVNEIEWFISTSWNAAVLEMSTNPNSVLASRYWISVVKLIGYLPNEALTYEKLKQAKTSLFCLINCNLDRIRKLRKLESVSKVDDNEDRMVMDFSNEHEIDAVIGETLLIIQKFREAFEKVKKYGSKEIEMPDPTLGYSVFKELELSLWSKDYESIPELIKYAASINAPLYVFERMVEIAITECAPGAITFTIVKPTLDLMLTVQEDFSIVKFAMWFRVLIESASVSNNLSDVVCDLFRQVLQVIESEPLYPQQEIHWLMTSAWNNGVQADSLSDSDLARIWIEIAVNLAGYDKSESSVASTIRSEYPKFLADLLG